MNGASHLGLHSIAGRLRARENLRQLKIAAMFVFGVPLFFVGPLTTATCLWAGLRTLDQGWAIRWSWLFWPLVVVMIPLLYRMERRTGGDYYGRMLSETEVYAPPGGHMFMPGSGNFIIRGTYLALNARPVASHFIEVFLFGPRLVLSASRQRRICRALVGVDVARAVEIVRFLGSVEGGVDLPAVLRGAETCDSLLPTLAYLVFYQWIGVRGEWERIWLTSEARRSLSPVLR